MRKVAIGQLVISVAGRDSGHIYVVIGYGKPGFILVANGSSRAVATPKTKNIRHVRPKNQIISGLTDKISGGSVTDEEIRQAIATAPDNL